MSRKKRICVAAVLAAVVLIVLGYAAMKCVSKAVHIYREFRTYIETINETSQQILYTIKSSEGEYEFDYSWVNEKTLIAHALGGIDGESYTNSMEALELAYDNGIRVFEGDFQYLDGHTVLMHNMRDVYELTGMDISEITYESFMDSKLFGKYTAMDIDEIVRYLSTHRDAYFMTDSKYLTNPYSSCVLSTFVVKAMEYDQTVLDRVIIQIYSQEMLDEVMDIYPFKSVVYTLYASSDTPEEAMQFCLRSGVKAITMPESYVEKEVISRLDAVGIYSMTHTINDVDKINELFAYGVDVVYTDFAVPEMLD